MKKFNAKTWKNKLDKLWSLAVRARDKRCMYPGCTNTESLQAHHALIRKGRSISTRWDVDNGITLCYACHIYKVHGDGTIDIMKKYQHAVDKLWTTEQQDSVIFKGKNAVLKSTLGSLEPIKEYLEDKILEYTELNTGCIDEENNSEKNGYGEDVFEENNFDIGSEETL